MTEVKKNDVIIRKAEKKDYQRILDILNMAIAGREVTALLSPVTMEGRKQWFKDHEDGIHSIYVAEQDGFVLGWMAINAYRSGREGF
ncbi:GNAT family N-acetyltransferase [Eubacterium aggregans]|uniref:GNAT family N-acetyltransferase n=1 Tax=Eubacterium aggregans TaxID=81409 RepID=UPI003F398EF8